MAHIHTGDGQHDLTVSAFIVRTDFDRPKIMLHRHKKLNTLLQFGGHVELDENPWQAIKHELLEESGYELSRLKLLQPHDRLKNVSDGSVLHPQPAYINTHPIDTRDLSGKHFHIDVGYAFVADEEPQQAIAADESADIVMLDKEELLALNHKDIWPATTEICLHVLDVCLPNWEQVPAPS